MIKKYSFLLPVFFAAFSFEYAAAQQIELVKDIPGSFISTGLNTGSNPGSFLTLNGKLYFTATDLITGHEIWESEGTEATTRMLIDLDYGENQGVISNIYKLGNKIIFAGNVTRNVPGSGITFDTLAGVELYVSDGTANGTTLVKDIFPGPNSSYLDEYGKIDTFNHKMYFPAQDSTLARSLWVTDGTEMGTYRIKKGSHDVGVSIQQVIGITQNKVFFTAIDTSGGPQLWVTDGTVAGTQQLKNIPVDHYNCKAVNGKLYFQAYNTPTDIGQFWVSDGTVAGTFMLSDSIEFSTETATAFNSRIYFSGRVPSANFGKSWFDWRLCYTDGSAQGTGYMPKILTDVNNNRPISVFNGKMYFAAADTGSIADYPEFFPFADFELWESDGTETGTLLKADLGQGTTPVASRPAHFFIYNQKLYFLGTISSHDLTNMTPRKPVYSVNMSGNITEHIHDGSFFILRDQNDKVLQSHDGVLIDNGDFMMFRDNPLSETIWPPALTNDRLLKNNYFKFGNDYYFTARFRSELGYQLYKFKMPPPPVHINNLSFEKQINLYPNPAQNELTVIIEEKVQYRIINLIGSELKRGNLFAGLNKIDTKGLPPGNYVLMTKKKNGEVQRAKFTISK